MWYKQNHSLHAISEISKSDLDGSDDNDQDDDYSPVMKDNNDDMESDDDSEDFIGWELKEDEDDNEDDSEDDSDDDALYSEEDSDYEGEDDDKQNKDNASMMVLKSHRSEKGNSCIMNNQRKSQYNF